ncbi:sushi domain-containing protein 6 isoform X1 [Trichechus manatus latirostris]|uniref:Sushi domain-containing protein 6 isoform X1 n=1 Tax=Trichechus manatus latirostris TaxID=127582 RepID=A0A2Y9QFI2_TRIMA|nr:sushi domain-containing protein 6 isoform X1 [Trichechus manatus latirostris]XP_023582093.1 sushi domain-containing protein 6 isoform X1 [Trichechus manatus latirostris]XP_023582094.1 sushi domain-containing protein 6 isoform X1 [Trichechus manatus latirostris]XP_023582095.1 sushi domain-containing protein 6 isoform X1 [Trichechus manatus latirostris]XP_023582096.1 sushi domain-containing protein 6 isoform X1 [Trichechus manatus latirostris]XP_023582097.1 sushi domain-containing protein 6 i
MCHGRIAPKSTSAFAVASVGHGVLLPLVILSTLLGDGLASVCPRPPEPENGGYICHPRPCRDPLTAGSVIEYLCAEGYMLKGDYKYLTCKNGEWKPAMEISCHLNEEKDAHTSLGAPTLSIVASTASSVALILLLVVLFVLLQPKLKSFHHSRRDQGVSGDQVSIMVDGVQVALPSYEEAVYGSSGHCVPPADSRVQIVLSEGSEPSGRSVPREQQLQDQGACSSAGGEDEAPGHSGLCEAWGSRGSETVMVHQATTSSWVAGSGNSRPTHKEAPDSESSDIQSLLSLTSEEYTDGRWSVLITNCELFRVLAESEEGLRAFLIMTPH